MSDRTLTAYLYGARVGWFAENSGAISFRYDPDWVSTSGAQVLSLSLPKTRPLHADGAPAAFVWGLLPDNTAVLERWGRQFGVNARNPMALLAHVGLDVAGAVQLSSEDAATLPVQGGLDPISDERIGEHLRSLRADPSSWLLSDDRAGSFSLAGAQSKFTLHRTAAGWANAWGSVPSTHIVKPGILGLDFGDIDEHLCLDTARRLGLDAATTTIASFGEERAIVVERYDRRFEGGDWLRVHQEDFCQATGTHPAVKYERDGGPGIAGCVAVIRRAVRGPARAAAVDRFIDGVAFNWIVAGTDAHAKNYSLLHAARTTRLAPLYDIASVLPYPALGDDSGRKLTMAMRIAGRYRIREIDGAHWIREFDALGLDGRGALERIRDMAAGVRPALAEAIASTDLRRIELDFAERLLDAVGHRSEAILADLERTIVR